MLIVLIHNDGTGANESANYDVEVRINERTLSRFRVEGHDRKLGWQELLRRVSDEADDLAFEERYGPFKPQEPKPIKIVKGVINKRIDIASAPRIRTRNRAQCAKCDSIIESFSRHDYVSCKCGAIAVDGGNDYCRRVGNPEDFIEMP